MAQDQAVDPFGSGGGGLYGGTMIGGQGTRRKHISERGVHADGSPLKGDPLAVLKKSRERLEAQMQEIYQKIEAIDAQLAELAKQAAPQAKRPLGKPAPKKTKAPAKVEEVSAKEPDADETPADE